MKQLRFNWRVFDDFRRRAAARVERWTADDRDVIADGRWIGRMSDTELAKLVTITHNMTLPMCNMILMLLKKRVDQENIDDEG